MIGVGRISDPFSIPRKCRIGCRNSREERLKTMRLHVVSNQLAALLRTERKYLLSVPARRRIRIRQRSIGEPNWFPWVAEEPCFHRQQPDIRLLVSSGLIHEIFLIRSPEKATLIGTQLPKFPQ